MDNQIIEFLSIDCDEMSKLESTIFEKVKVYLPKSWRSCGNFFLNVSKTLQMLMQINRTELPLIEALLCLAQSCLALLMVKY